MNTAPGVATPAEAVLAQHQHLRVDNSGADPGAVAEQVVAWLAN